MAVNPVIPMNMLTQSAVGSDLAAFLSSQPTQAAVVAAASAMTTIPLMLPRILATSTDTPADLVTDYVPGVVGNIVRWGFITEVVCTSGGTGDIDLDLQIGSTPVTGAKFTALAETDFNVIGKVKQSAALSAANTLAADSTLSIVCTESTTNFTAGVIVPIVWIQLTDLDAKINAILTALKNANLMASA